MPSQLLALEANRCRTAFPDFRVTLEDATEEGDTLVGRFKYRGTSTEPFRGYLSTGNVVEMRSIDIWRVKDGLLFEYWDELNTLDFFMQLGCLLGVELPPTDSKERFGVFLLTWHLASLRL